MPNPASLLKQWAYCPQKQFGQNFLIEPATADMIIRKSGITGEDRVLEIGPGLGALTIPLSKIARKIDAVEIDDRLAQILQTELNLRQIANVSLSVKDILQFDLDGLIRSDPAPLTVIANLPYHISSQILVRLIQYRQWLTGAVLMFQKELAQRITASPGNKAYGRLSVMLQYCAKVKSIAQIKSHQFFPRPKVDSTVIQVKFVPPELPADDEHLLFRVIKSAFGKRRKVIKNAVLDDDFGLSDGEVVDCLISLGIAPSRRAETLTVNEYIRFSNAMGRRLLQPRPMPGKGAE